MPEVDPPLPEDAFSSLPDGGGDADRVEEDGGDVEFVAPVSDTRPRGRGDRAWVGSLAVAVAVHAAVIGAGVYWHRSTATAPQLAFAYGWASAIDGHDLDAGADAPILRGEPPPPLAFRTAADSAAEVSAPDLSEVPADAFEAVAPPEPVVVVALSRDLGTSDVGPLLPTSAVVPSAPLRARRPPAFAGAGGDGQEGDGTTGEREADNAGRGHAASGDGAGSGARAGVPDGMPVPHFSNRPPDYPERALRQNWVGTVVLSLDLDEGGRVRRVVVKQSSGHDLLDDAAVDAARAWRFTPATRDGQPVAVTVERPVRFAVK